MEKSNSKPELVSIPPIPEELLRALKQSTDPFLRSASGNIAALNEFVAKFPARYGWNFKTAEALKAEIGLLKPNDRYIGAVNALYWRDTAANCEAYTVMSVWRMVELIRSAVWALAREELVCAALLARSALESAVQFVDTSRTISATLNGLAEHDFKQDFVVSSDLENIILKTVFASRLPDSEDFYSPTNIVTIIGRISKIPGQAGVHTNYGVLCEVAHPNFIGRSIYLLDVRPGAIPGNEVRTIGHGVGPSAAPILNSVVWAISWASATQVTAGNLMQSAVKTMMRKVLEAQI